MKVVLDNLEQTIALDGFPKNDNLSSLYFYVITIVSLIYTF